jgi:hypothetical protein
MCQTQNSSGASVCENCGRPLPLPPGVQTKAKAS